MTGLSNNKEFLRMSIFFLWLINISGFFGITSDQNEFFLATTPYVLSLTLLLLILNHDLSNKKSKIGLMLIFLFGLIVEILGVNYGLFFGEYSYGANLGPKIYEVPYVIGFNWVLLIIATGSEVELAIEVAVELKKFDINCRVVSMPSQELFDAQPKEYKEEILPTTVINRYAIEMLSPFGWEKYTFNSNNVFGINRFGLSGNVNDVKDALNYNVKSIVDSIIQGN